MRWEVPSTIMVFACSYATSDVQSNPVWRGKFYYKHRDPAAASHIPLIFSSHISASKWPPRPAEYLLATRYWQALQSLYGQESWKENNPRYTDLHILHITTRPTSTRVLRMKESCGVSNPNPALLVCACYDNTVAYTRAAGVRSQAAA